MSRTKKVGVGEEAIEKVVPIDTVDQEPVVGVSEVVPNELFVDDNGDECVRVTQENGEVVTLKL